MRHRHSRRGSVEPRYSGCTRRGQRTPRRPGRNATDTSNGNQTPARQASDPELRAKLTTTYAIGCTRLLISSDQYPTLSKAHVKPVTDPIANVGSRTLITSTGRHVDTDVLIYGTAIDAQNACAAGLMAAGRLDGHRMRRVVPPRWRTVTAVDVTVVMTFVLCHVAEAGFSDDGYQFQRAIASSTVNVRDDFCTWPRSTTAMLGCDNATQRCGEFERATMQRQSARVAWQS